MASDVWYWFGENCIYKFTVYSILYRSIWIFIESKDSLHYYYLDNIFTNNCLNCGYRGNEILSSACSVLLKRSYLVRKLLTILFIRFMHVIELESKWRFYILNIQLLVYNRFTCC